MERGRRGDPDFKAGQDFEAPEVKQNPREWTYEEIKDKKFGDFLTRAHQNLIENENKDKGFEPAEQLYSFVDTLSLKSVDKKMKLEHRVNKLTDAFRGPETYGFFRGVAPSSEREKGKKPKIYADFETMMARYAFLYVRKVIDDRGEKVNSREKSTRVFERSIEKLGDHPLANYFSERKEIYDQIRKRDTEAKPKSIRQDLSHGKDWAIEHLGDLKDEVHWTAPDLRKFISDIELHHPNWWADNWSARSLKNLEIREGFLKRIDMMRRVDRGYFGRSKDLPSPREVVNYLHRIANELDEKTRERRSSVQDKAFTLGQASAERGKKLIAAVKREKQRKIERGEFEVYDDEEDE